MKRLLAVSALFAFTAVASAQSTTPYLQGVFPPGCKAGAETSVNLRGANMENIKALQFSHPGIKAVLTGGEATPPPASDPADPKTKRKTGAPPASVSKQLWKVTVAADVPTGLHELRAVTRNGISNSRAFIVSNLAEAIETVSVVAVDPREAAKKAQTVDLNTVVNGQISKAEFDWFKVKLAKGKRTVIECSAEHIDSKMSPAIQLYDPQGRSIATSSFYLGSVRYALIDVTPAEDGDYMVKIWDYIYQGGPIDYYYRLTIHNRPQIEFALPNVLQSGKTADVTFYGRNLPGGVPAPEAVVHGKALEKITLKVTAPAVSEKLDVGLWMRSSGVTVRGFDYRLKDGAGWSNPVLLAINDAPVIMEAEGNDKPEAAQTVAVPCDIVGQFGRPGDSDCFRFDAKRGDSYRIEVISSRIGTVGDPELYVGRYTPKTEKTAETWAYLQENIDDDPGGSFGAAVTKNQQTGSKFDVRSYDPRTVWTAPADGSYFVQVRDLNGAGRGDCRFVYRVAINKAEPDFRLAVIHVEDVRADAVTVRQGGHQAYTLLCGRYDGMNETIKIEVQGLPKGVSCPGAYLGPGVDQIPLIFYADEKADLWAGAIRVIGTASFKGKPMIREAVGAMLVQEGGAQGQGPRVARLTRDIVLAVTDTAPFTLTTEPREISAVPGGKTDVKIKVTRRAGFDDAVTLLNFDNAALPAQGQQTKAQATIAKGKDDAIISIAVPKAYGTYTYAVLGQATANLSTNPADPKAARKATKIAEPSNAFILTVAAPFEFKTGPVPGKLSAGGAIEIPVAVTRIAGKTEDIKVDLNVPKNRGLTVEPALLTKGAVEGKIIVKADAKAAPGSVPGLNLVGSITVSGSAQTITHPATVTLEVVPGSSAPPPMEKPKPVEKPVAKPVEKAVEKPKAQPAPASASVAPLVEMLKGEREGKLKAAAALAELGPAAKDAVGALADVVATETSGTVIRAAAAALAKIGAAAKPALPKLKAARDGNGAAAKRPEVKAAVDEAIKIIEAAK